MIDRRLGESGEFVITAAITGENQPADHTAARSRTIPSRIWRGMASLNDSAGLTEIDWRHLLETVLWMIRLTLIAGAISTYLDGQLSRTLIAILAIIAINTWQRAQAPAKGEL